MPKLLVPTDFSKGAAVAARYAVNLAAVLNLEVELLHAYQVARPAGSLINVEEHMQAGVRADFAVFFEDLRQNTNPDVKLHMRTMQRSAVDAIAYITKLEGDEVRAVVMGTHGQSALEQIFVGSTTRKTIEAIQHPVIAVPPLLKGDSGAPQRILWALDGKTSPDSYGARFVRELAGKPGGKLTFFYAGVEEENAGVQADILAGDTPHILYSTNLEEKPVIGIEEAVAETGSDLLVMTHRDRGILASWFGRSTTAKLLRSTNMPVLVLQP
ncbi:MAG: universal stress protein [Saprospiraceae bacterium]